MKRALVPHFARRIARTQELTTRFPESASLLAFYLHILAFQQSLFDRLASGTEADVRAVLRFLPSLMDLVRARGPAKLAAFAVDPDAIVDFWEKGIDLHGEPLFFARALLQPYAEWLAMRGAPQQETQQAICPFCGGKPVAGVLRGEGDGAKRSLICVLCATEWQYRRVVCPKCGEQDKDKLPVYTAEGIDYVRVEACDVCMTYIKSIDLTRDGHAAPVADELATVALNIWADEHGYVKLETNLLGM